MAVCMQENELYNVINHAKYVYSQKEKKNVRWMGRDIKRSVNLYSICSAFQVFYMMLFFLYSNWLRKEKPQCHNIKLIFGEIGSK